MIKMLRAMRVFFGCVLLCLASDAFAVDATVSGVTVRQRWPWSRLVDIDFVVSCDPTQQVDIYNVSDGARRIVFDPTQTVYTNNDVMTPFRVALTPVPVPQSHLPVLLASCVPRLIDGQLAIAIAHLSIVSWVSA